MKHSSTAQLEFRYFEDDAASDEIAIDDLRGGRPKSAIKDVRRAKTIGSNIPNIQPHDAVYAATSRIAGRINAANISQEEIDNFLAERQKLLDKQFAGSITRQDQIRLEYVRWNLDRIEDARFGQSLDRLEAYVSQYERIFDQIEQLQMQLVELVRRKK